MEQYYTVLILTNKMLALHLRWPQWLGWLEQLPRAFCKEWQWNKQWNQWTNWFHCLFHCHSVLKLVSTCSTIALLVPLDCVCVCVCVCVWVCGCVCVNYCSTVSTETIVVERWWNRWNQYSGTNLTQWNQYSLNYCSTGSTETIVVERWWNQWNQVKVVVRNL